jgi:hypothetical protein
MHKKGSKNSLRSEAKTRRWKRKKIEVLWKDVDTEQGSRNPKYAIDEDNDPPPACWDNCWEAEPVQTSLRFSCSRPISRYYANPRTWDACPIDSMEILGNIYGNGSKHVTRRVKLIEMLNWESLLIPSWLSSCRSMNSTVGVIPHGSAKKVKLLLNSSHIEPQAVKPQRHHEDDDLE